MIKDKIKDLTGLQRVVSACKKRKEKVVFTNGCFDIFHLGHIRYLEKAKRLGNRLVVALNSDISVRKIKGRRRPIFSENERAGLLAACECVDYVTVFGETTPLKLIKTLKPDILVKGGDWHKRDIVGAEFVRSYGGKVVRVKFIKGFSTSSIIARIKQIR